MSNFHLATLGCRVNQSESRAIAKQLETIGWKYTTSPEKADIIIINTCLVTNVAERKSRQIIRQLQKKSPQAKIYICGCYANLKPNKLAEEFKKGTIVPKESKTAIKQWDLPAITPNGNVENVFRKEHLREFIKVEDGCNQFCTYCIIPYARGGEIISTAPNQILTEIRNMTSKGIQEVILTGINLGRYNYQESDLVDLLTQISEKKITRIRLSSIEPNLISDKLLSLIHKRPNIMPHLHIPLQSGSSEILKEMKRPYTKEQYQSLINKIVKMGINVTTDLIVGFPTETQETLAETKAFISELPISDIHTFKYSPRKGTKAYNLKQLLKGDEIETALQQTLILKKELHQKYIKAQNNFEVLFEQQKDGFWQGLSRGYIRIYLESKQPLMGKIVKLNLKEIDSSGRAIGELC